MHGSASQVQNHADLLQVSSLFMLCFCLVFKSKTRVRIFKTLLLSVLQVLFWGEEGSGVYHFHWRKPRGFQSPARAPLWRLGGTKHLLSR